MSALSFFSGAFLDEITDSSAVAAVFITFCNSFCLDKAIFFDDLVEGGFAFAYGESSSSSMALLLVLRGVKASLRNSNFS